MILKADRPRSTRNDNGYTTSIEVEAFLKLLATIALRLTNDGGRPDDGGKNAGGSTCA